MGTKSAREKSSCTVWTWLTRKVSSTVLNSNPATVFWAFWHKTGKILPFYHSALLLSYDPVVGQSVSLQPNHKFKPNIHVPVDCVAYDEAGISVWSQAVPSSEEASLGRASSSEGNLLEGGEGSHPSSPVVSYRASYREVGPLLWRGVLQMEVSTYELVPQGYMAPLEIHKQSKK